MNVGWQRTEGIDFQASYDWEWEGLGAFNAGIIGTYYLEPGVAGSRRPHRRLLPHRPCAALNGVEQIGVELRPRFKYRARLGWSDGTWSVTGFMDYESTSSTRSPRRRTSISAASRPAARSAGYRPTRTHAGSRTTPTIQPCYYTFDLSLGYNTGDRPANEYLRNVSVQLVVQNITDKTAPYEYRITTGGGFPVRLRHHQEPVRPHDLAATAKDVLGGTTQKIGEVQSLAVLRGAGAVRARNPSP